jgi:hypothetical protein
MIAAIFLVLLAGYLAVGFLFSIPFVFVGVARVDARAKHSGWVFRLLIFPGAMAFWPLLACRWIAGKGVPPGEKTAHRITAGREAA